MSAYPPPTEDLPIFNPAVFFVDETGITLGEADARYLKLSGGVMTGTLAVPAITLNGSNLETDITNLENKTQDLTFSGNTSTFDGNIEATGNIYVSGNNKFIGVDNGTSSIKIQNHANHADFEVVNPDNAIHFKNAGVELFELTNTETLFYKPLKANTSVDIGDGTTRFNTIYASTLNLPTISDVASQIVSNTSNITTLQTKTTQLSYDSGTTTSTFGGSTLDVNATLALPLHADVDSTLTTIEGNITTLQTKTTQLSYDSGTTLSSFGSQVKIIRTGDNTAGETSDNHQLRLTTGIDNKTMMLGYDNTVDIGYINCAKNGSFQPLCLQTRGNNVGIGLTNPSELLHVNGVIKSTNLKTANHTDVDTTLTTLNLKTTQLSYDAGTTTTTLGGSTLDVNATLALPLHADVDSTLTTIEGNVSTNTTKLTGISYDSGTSKTTINNIKTSDDIEVVESNINFNRNDGSSAGVIQYQSEGFTFQETRGGNNTSFVLGSDDIVFNTTSTEKLRIPSGAQPVLQIGTDGGSNGSMIMMEGTTNDTGLYNCVLESRIFQTGTEKSELVIFKGNDHLGTNTDRIRLRAGQIAFDVFSSPTSDRTVEDIKTTINSNSISSNVQMIITKAGNDNDGENNSNHCLRLTSGTNNRTMFMGVDDTDQIGYINCAQSGSTKNICIQTRGSNLAVGKTTANYRLDINGDTRTTGTMTASSYINSSSKKIKNVESTLNDVSTNQEALNLFNSIPLSKYTYIDKVKNKNYVNYGLIAEDMPNDIYRFDYSDYIPCIYQYAEIIKEDDKYKITFNEKLDCSKIQNENDTILCYLIKDNKYDTDKTFILKDFEIIDDYTIKGAFKYEFTENKIFVYGVEGMIPAINKNSYFELTSCVVKHLLKENNELKERLNKIEEMLNIN